MDAMFNSLLKMMSDNLNPTGGIKTDNSILLIYPPERELDFREHLLDAFLPALDAQGSSYRVADLTGFMFRAIGEENIEALMEDEFEDYRWMLQGLSKRVESALVREFEDLAEQVPGGNVIVYATVALHPLVRFGEVLRNVRDLDCRIALAFPGEERGGRLHFMNQPDGGNYLAVKLFWQGRE